MLLRRSAPRRPGSPHPFADLVFYGTLYVDMPTEQVPVLGGSLLSAMGESQARRRRRLLWTGSSGLERMKAASAAWTTGSDAESTMRSRA